MSTIWMNDDCSTWKENKKVLWGESNQGRLRIESHVEQSSFIQIVDMNRFFTGTCERLVNRLSEKSRKITDFTENTGMLRK